MVQPPWGLILCVHTAAEASCVCRVGHYTLQALPLLARLLHVKRARCCRRDSVEYAAAGRRQRRAPLNVRATPAKAGSHAIRERAVGKGVAVTVTLPVAKSCMCRYMPGKGSCCASNAAHAVSGHYAKGQATAGKRHEFLPLPAAAAAALRAKNRNGT